MSTATSVALSLSGRNVTFAGQRYIPVTPHRITLSFRGDDTPGATHVVAISGAPNPITPSASLYVLELSSRGRGGAVEEEACEADAPSVWHIELSQKPSNITSFCDLTFGDHHSGLCYVASLSDNAVVLVSRIVDDDDGAVSYRKVGTILRSVGNWTASCVVQRGPHGGRVAAAHSDGVISLIDVLKDRLQYAARLEPASSALSSFPITQLAHLRSSSEDGGDTIALAQDEAFAVELLALCQSVIVHIRCAAMTNPSNHQAHRPHRQADDVLAYHAGAQQGSFQALRAWRWSPSDPIESFTLHGDTLYAGTTDGTIAVWALQGDETASPPNSSASCLPTAQFLCDLSSSSPESTIAPKRRAPSVSSLVVRHNSLIVAGSFSGLVSIWSLSSAGGRHHPPQNVVKRQQGDKGGGNPDLVVGEALSPSLSTGGAEMGGGLPLLCGHPPICGVASSHRYLVAVDSSGMLSMWEWLR